MKWLRRRRKQKRVARVVDTTFDVAGGTVDVLFVVAEVVAALVDDH